MYKNGFLASNGGWLDQSNKYIEIVTFIDAEITRHNKEAEEKNVSKPDGNNLNFK